MTREQIYKAALDEIAKIYPPVVRFQAGTLARAALEAAAKVGDDAFVCNAVCCDDSHPDHAQELRRLLTETEAPPPAGTMNAIDAYLRGTR